MTYKRVLLNTIWGLTNLAIFGAVVIMVIKDGMIWFLLLMALASGLFIVIPAILHLNYWWFDRETVCIISVDTITLRNKLSGNEITIKVADIEALFKIEPTSWHVPWMHEYTIIKLRNGKSIRVTNYIIDPDEIIKLLDLKKISQSREIFVPTVQLGLMDKELRAM